MPLPWPLYIPPLSAWQWPGRDVGSSPVTGQPAQLAPPPGSSAPTTGFPDTVGRPLTVLLPQFQAVVPVTRPSSPPTPVVSTASMPRPRFPGSRPADVEVRHRMDFTPVPGGPRPLPPAQGFPLPSSIQPLPVSSPSTGLPGVQDFVWLQTTWRLTTQLHLQEKAGLLAVSSVTRYGPDPLLDMQSILATMQDTFLQQVKGLLGVAPPQPSLSPSVLTDMGQDVLWQPSPAGDREALRAGPKSGSKRARESSRSCIRSGDLSPSERRDWRSRDSCCHSLSSHDTPYRSRSRSLLPSGIESVVGRHHSRSLSGSWPTSPPGPQPASVDAAHHRLHVGLHPRDVARHLRQDGRLLSDTTPPTSLDAPPLDTAALVGPLLTTPGLVPGRVAIRIGAWTVRDLRLLRINACCYSVRYLHVILSMTTIGKQASPDKNCQALTLEDFHRIFQETMKVSSSDPESHVQPPVLSLTMLTPSLLPKKRLLNYS